MHTGKTVFAQLMMFMPENEFQKCVDHYKGDYRIRSFSCREHFLVTSFAQLTGHESLRDIENCLTAFSTKLYHSGIRSLNKTYYFIKMKFNKSGEVNHIPA